MSRRRAPAHQPRSADGYALTFTPPQPVLTNLITLREDIAHGQHIATFRLQADTGDGWRPLASGTTIGHLRALRIPPTRVHRLRLLIDLSYGPARVTHLGAHLDRQSEHRRRADNHD